MSFKIKPVTGSEQEVTFDFDIMNDTTEGVAKEMVRELKLNSGYIDVI